MAMKKISNYKTKINNNKNVYKTITETPLPKTSMIRQKRMKSRSLFLKPLS